MPATVTASGSARETLDRVIAQSAIVFRCAFCAAIPAMALATGAPAGGRPAAVAVSGMLVWSGVVLVICLRQRHLHRWLIYTDALICAALLLGAGWLVPGRLVG